MQRAGPPLKRIDTSKTPPTAGIVLLKNEAVAVNGEGSGSGRPLLPFDLQSVSKLCVLGPLADSPEHMLGNYYVGAVVRRGILFGGGRCLFGLGENGCMNDA